MARIHVNSQSDIPWLSLFVVSGNGVVDFLEYFNNSLETYDLKLKIEVALPRFDYYLLSIPRLSSSTV